MVFYLKYRPQKISDLDSTEVRERLSMIFSKQSLPHAFLFTGPKGLGKTSAARIIAKAVNCTNKRKGSFEPCGKCDFCVSITNGTNLDVVEIDAASNRGIDEIRDLREKIRLSPVSAKKKVYIIDEVHMLTTEAFNALLKTLEEPPVHALFVLCTTEPQKVPATIISRCLHISFKDPTDLEMKRSFKRIMDGEGLKVDDEGLDAVLKLSEGSFRDGSKIMEEVSINFGKRKIGRKEIEETFNISTISNSKKSLLLSLASKDAKRAVSEITNLSRQKVDLRFFTEELLSLLHQMLLTSFELGKDEEAQRLLKETKFGIEDLKKLIDLFSKAHTKIKLSVSPQIPLEIAAIDFCLASKPIEQEASAAKAEPKSEAVAHIASPDDKILTELIEKVNLHNRSAAGLLRGVKIEAETNGKIVLITSYKFHKERLDDPKVRKIIQDAYKEISGKEKKIEINLKV